MLHIDDLAVSIDQKVITSPISLVSIPGSFQVIMGPNGSGKSSLLAAIMGNPRYKITHGRITWDDEDITEMPLEKRARLGIFLAFQYSYEIPGVPVFLFLQEAYRALYSALPPLADFQKEIEAACDTLKLDRSFLYREVNVGFSGGEKKRLELVQMLILKPRLLLLDELDSGLDQDGIECLRTVLMQLRAYDPQTTIIMVTHNARMGELFSPDAVHIMMHGKLMSPVGSVFHEIQHKGYDVFCS